MVLGLLSRDHVGVGDPEIIPESETGTDGSVLFSRMLRREPWVWVSSIPCLVDVVSDDGYQ